MITKSKIRKYLHLAGLLIAGAAGAAIWLAKLSLPVSAKIGASLVLVTTLLTSLNAVMPNLFGFVESLPIPETETTTTTTTTTAAVVAQAAPLVPTSSEDAKTPVLPRPTPPTDPTS